MARKLIYVSLCIGFLALSAFAQQAQNKSSKIDTLLQNQKVMMQNQQTILKNVEHHYVLQGKRFGVAFNPMLALLGTAMQHTYISAAFSILRFKGSEIIFPLYYDHSYKKNDPRDVLTADIQYRKFFNKERPGFFVSAGMRYAYLMGEKNVDWDINSDPNSKAPTRSVSKFGVYFGIGYRYFSPSGLYWGTAIDLGTYFSDDTNKFNDTFMDASRVLFDFTFLRVGYAF